MLYAIAAYGLWGILPLFWKQLAGVPAVETLAHRILWSASFSAVLLTSRGEWPNVGALLRNRGKVAYLAAAALLIGVNWGVYIWSVGSGHVVDASMGYFINPLVSVLLGVAVLKERLAPAEFAALALAAFGVSYLGISHGAFPWIALVLAATFGLYGLIKKLAGADALAGLFVESCVLAPVALAFLAGKQMAGTAAFGAAPLYRSVLFVLSGALTGLPLLWFARASQTVELSTMGFLLYITPSLTLLMGVFVFRERFSSAHAVCFGAIWTAIAVYLASKAGRRRKAAGEK